MLTVIDKCGDIEEARNVVTELMDMGFDRSDINLIINTPDDSSTVNDSSIKSEDSSHSGLVNALEQMGVPEADACRLDSDVRQGKILLAVNTPEDKADLVVELMGSYKALTAESGMEADIGDVRVYGSSAYQAMDDEDLTGMITLEQILISTEDPFDDEFEVNLLEDEGEDEISPDEVDFVLLSPQIDLSQQQGNEQTQVAESDLKSVESKQESAIEKNEQELERVRTGGFYSQSRIDYSEVPNDLVKLENLTDYKVADGEPDPRGWDLLGKDNQKIGTIKHLLDCADLLGKDNQKIGTIKHLLASPSKQMAYFAIVDCGDWLEDKLFLVPLENINFDRDREKAIGPYVKEQFLNAPAFIDEDRDFYKHYSYWTTGGTSRGMAKSAGSSL